MTRKLLDTQGVTGQGVQLWGMTYGLGPLPLRLPVIISSSPEWLGSDSIL